MSENTSIRVAQTLGLTASAVLGGMILAPTLMVIPALLLAPSPILQKQWLAMYTRGAKICPKLSIFSALNLLYVSYKFYHQHNTAPLTEGGQWGMYAGAAGIVLMIIPYTFVAMIGTNQKLIDAGKRMEGADVSATEEVFVKKLADRWATLNLFRGFIPVVGTIVGLWAALG